MYLKHEETLKKKTTNLKPEEIKKYDNNRKTITKLSVSSSVHVQRKLCKILKICEKIDVTEFLIMLFNMFNIVFELDTILWCKVFANVIF